MASYGLDSNLQDRVPLTRSSDLVLVLNTPKGRGVFAARNIPAHTVLDVCPVLVLEPEEFKQHVQHTRIYFYTYNWPYTPSGGAVSEPAKTGTILDDTSTNKTVNISAEATSLPTTTDKNLTHSPTSPSQTDPDTAGHPSPPISIPKLPTQTQALPLGLGSLFNHSTMHQNVGWTRDVVRQLITYTTLRAVSGGEELCISYGESGRLGFDDADAEAMRREDEERLRGEERAFWTLGGDVEDGDGERD